MSAVVVSVVHVSKGGVAAAPRLDGREVDTITAFLFHRGGHEDPARLAANDGKSFIGSYVLGMGFTFDDTDTKGVASSLTEMRRLIDADPSNAEVILPYIGGDEVRASPAHEHHRYVINFGERSEEECRRRWPKLMAIVEERVRPERMINKRETRKRYWWRFGETTPALFEAIAGLDRVMVTSQTSSQPSYAFLPTPMVYSHKLVVFPLTTHAAFCALQAQPHESWALFFGSTMKDDPVYTPSDCFDTFPFPEGWETDPGLEAAGRDYYEFRAELMQRTGAGLRHTYNRFHDPNERDPDIERLRELHAAMDRAVLAAYGWEDVPTECKFVLDYEVDDDDSSRRKKPYRYRWPDEVRDDVLARLIELNAERAAAERRSGTAASDGARGRSRRTAPVGAGSEELF